MLGILLPVNFNSRFMPFIYNIDNQNIAASTNLILLCIVPAWYNDLYHSDTANVVDGAYLWYKVSTTFQKVFWLQCLY